MAHDCCRDTDRYTACPKLLGVSGVGFVDQQMIDKAGLFEQFIATPSNHRVHHGCDPKYLDRNYGEVLIVWDRLFGTYQREEEPPTYGVTERLESCNPYVIETEGWRWLARKMARARGWRAKLSCLYLPPGVEPG